MCEVKFIIVYFMSFETRPIYVNKIIVLMKVVILILFFSAGLIGILVACIPPHKQTKVVIGDPTYVCVGIAPINWGTNGTYLRVASTVIADEFSSVRVKKCEIAEFVCDNCV